MLDFQLEKYQDFKGYIEEYLDEQIDKEELLNILHSLEVMYEHRHTKLFEHLEKDPVIRKQHASLIAKLREAAECFEDARDEVEAAVLDDRLDDIEEALELFKHGNRLLNEAYYDLEEFLERSDIQGSM